MSNLDEFRAILEQRKQGYEAQLAVLNKECDESANPTEARMSNFRRLIELEKMVVEYQLLIAMSSPAFAKTESMN